MAKQQSQWSDRVLDKRVVERYVRKGALSERDLAKLLKELPDVASASEPLDLDEPAAPGNGEGGRA